MSIKSGWHYDDLNIRYYREENGDKIHSEQCLCAAYEPSECMCDCTSWNGYTEISDYFEELTEKEIMDCEIYDERALE